MRITNRHMQSHDNFFVVPENGPVLQGMPDCECLQVLSIHCQTTNDQHQRRQFNEQTKKGKAEPNCSIIHNPHINNKTKQEINHFIVGPGTKLT